MSNSKPKRKPTIKAYNYVYKIIQLSTGREYIGKHKTDNLNDGYMGSGTLITPAVLENPSDFVKTIIWYCDSESEMNELEASLVTEEYLLKNFPEKTFNQVPGGAVSMDVIAKWRDTLYKGNNPRGTQSASKGNHRIDIKNLVLSNGPSKTTALVVRGKTPSEVSRKSGHGTLDSRGTDAESKKKSRTYRNLMNFVKKHGYTDFCGYQSGGYFHLLCIGETPVLVVLDDKLTKIVGKLRDGIYCFDKSSKTYYAGAHTL